MLSLVHNLGNARNVFLQAFKEKSPYGKQIYSLSLEERLTYLWRGYHATLLPSVCHLNDKKTVSILPSLTISPLLNPFINEMNSMVEPIAESSSPVILQVASRQMPSWPNSFLCFKPKVAPVITLRAWEMNPAWIRDRQENLPIETIYARIFYAFCKALHTLKEA